MCRPLEPYAAHLFTTRQWSAGSSSDSEARSAAWPEVARCHGRRVSPGWFGCNQVHGAEYVVAESPVEPGAALPDADIVTTDRPDLALAVQVADCVPLLIADTVQRADRCRTACTRRGGCARGLAWAGGARARARRGGARPRVGQPRPPT